MTEENPLDPVSPIEVLVDGLPMYVNLSDFGLEHRDNWSSHIGWARVTRDTRTGQSKIEITLDENSSALLGNMVEVFDLKAIGFAGIKRLQHERTTP